MTASEVLVESAEALVAEPLSQGSVETAEEALPESPAADPSTMILGLPDQDTESECSLQKRRKRLRREKRVCLRLPCG
jgi:hypothetical protein